MLGGAVVVLLLLVIGAGLAAFRYLPAVDEARVLRTDLEAMVDRVQEAGLEIDGETLDTLEAQLTASRTRLDRLRNLLAGDPVIGLVRALPPASANIRGADGLLAAGQLLLDALGEGLGIGRRYVAIRDAEAANPGTGSVLAQLVELMATTRDEAIAANASVTDARRALADIGYDTVPQVRDVRNAMLARIDRYAPLLDIYVDFGERLPAILGRDGPRRYLILTQDPAEIRPTGGFVGSYGIVTFDNGSITDYRFQDVVPLDFPWDYPRIEPPQELADYLLGATQPWQFADANWSPDFPTSARDALRLYTNESGDDRIDGVLGITTYTIDEILKVTGPVEVPGYGVTVAPDETTLKVLQETRVAAPGENRKAFLAAFADQLVAALVALPPQSWNELITTAGDLRNRHLLLAWFPDASDQALAVRAGVDGAVRQDPGDYLFPVDANVAPATKLSAWTSRSLNLDVQIDEVGNARHTLEVTWSNQVETASAAPYREMQGVGGPILGMYFRLLVPERSRVESVTGGTLVPVTGPAVIAEEAGRTVIGTYVQVPAGETTLDHTWTSPYVADAGLTGGTYRLTLQFQAGMLPGPVRATIRVPEGNRIIAASPELLVSGASATLDTTFDRDLSVAIRYAP